MLVLYTSLGCPNCRKVKTYLKEKEINFIEKNIFKVLLNRNELSYLISHLENGVDDLVYTDSKFIKELNMNLNSIELTKLIEFIQNNPSIIKTPIILNEENKIDIDFIKNIKCEKTCAHYETCGAIKE